MPKALASGLRARGIDAVTVAEAGRRGATDPQHLAWATEQNRVLVTHDEDFLSLARQTAAFAGIAYSHPNKYRLGQLVHHLHELSVEMTGEDWLNQVIYL